MGSGSLKFKRSNRFIEIMKQISVFVNDEKVFDYDKETTFEEDQLAYLDRMDGDMDKGIKIQGELITDPDTRQRATFIAMNLIKALQQDNQGVLSVSCAYLNNRMPNLAEVHVNDQEAGIHIEFMHGD